jgi:virulence-associated protein VapD
MYAVAFDLVVADTEKHHPKGVTQAYTEIGAALGEYGFSRVQGSLYVTEVVPAVLPVRAQGPGSNSF